jgi:hypothetical protein
MPSAEEILNARDSDSPAPQETPIPVDYAEQRPRPERDEADKPPLQREPDEREPDDDDSDEAESERGPVPYQALKAERQKSKRYTEEVVDLRRQIADLTSAVLQQRQQAPQAPPQPPPEFDWDNPLGTVDQRLESRINQERGAIQAEFQRQREAMQSQFAITRHGEDTVKSAYQALATARESDPQWAIDYQRIMRSPDQYEAMVQWHKQKTALNEVGSDLEAYKAKIRAEYLDELRNGRVTDEPSAATTRDRPATAMPSNLSTARNVGSRNGAAWSGPTPLKDIFADR